MSFNFITSWRVLSCILWSLAERILNTLLAQQLFQVQWCKNMAYAAFVKAKSVIEQKAISQIWPDPPIQEA